MTRIDLPRKSRSRIHAAEGFLPLQAIKGVDSVWKIETGLECDRRLPRKLRITVRCDRMGGGKRKHSKSQFSQQPLTPFEPRFVFPDRLDMHQCLRRPKILRRVNCTLRFQSGPSSPLLCMSTVNLCFLSNHWPLSSPVSCFGTDLMPLNTLDCRKYSAARMGVCDFEPDPHLLCCAREQCFTNISTADDYFRALFRDSWSDLNHWMRTLVENTPLLDSEPSDLNPTLLTKQSSVKILSLDKSFCMKITLS